LAKSTFKSQVLTGVGKSLAQIVVKLSNLGKKYHMHDIMHLVTIRSAIERVYDAVTTVEDIRNWWTRDAILESRIGGTGEFGFSQRRVLTKITVDELKPPVHVKWKTIASTAPGGWGGTTMTFDLHADGSSTVLLFAHRGFEEANEGYARTTTGWGLYLVSLQQYLETGKGAPHPEMAGLVARFNQELRR
jgi:uncharacterized protein YndB with AHSA1/START domain